MPWMPWMRCCSMLVLLACAGGEVPDPAVDNAPPVAVADRVTVRHGDTATLEPLANDSDPDGDALTIVATAIGGNSRPSKPVKANNGTKTNIMRIVA